MIRTMILAGLALLPVTAAAQSASAPDKSAPPERVRIALTTTAGIITIDLEAKRAPITSANFLRYVDQKRLDGTTFYRTMKLGDGQGLIQGGPSGDPKRVLKPIAHEMTSKTGVFHTVGAISMARFAPGTATADFSILASPLPGLDADPKAEDPAGYAAFGHVVEGMDVVLKILNAQTSPTKGQGFLKGQMIAAPVKIVSARRVRAASVQPSGQTTDQHSDKR
jgi:peptidyl-prolyl cis-trans isomerase A (cyclophilin A)